MSRSRTPHRNVGWHSGWLSTSAQPAARSGSMTLPRWTTPWQRWVSPLANPTGTSSRQPSMMLSCCSSSIAPPGEPLATAVASTRTPAHGGNRSWSSRPANPHRRQIPTRRSPRGKSAASTTLRPASRRTSDCSVRMHVCCGHICATRAAARWACGGCRWALWCLTLSWCSDRIRRAPASPSPRRSSHSPIVSSRHTGGGTERPSREQVRCSCSSLHSRPRH